jgi:hypothetical protein
MSLRDNPDKFDVKTINCLVTDGGIGDLLCALVPIDYILKNCPWLNVLIWVPDFLKDFTKHVLPPNACVRNFTEGSKKYDKRHTTITTKWLGQHTPMKTNAVKYSFHNLCDYSPTIEECSYLKIKPELIKISQFNLPEKYIVMQGTFTEKVKSMPINTFNSLVDYFNSKGYSVVVLGSSHTIAGVRSGDIHSNIGNYDFTKTINLINKTSMLESAAIISGAKLFTCMDGGMMHIGAFTDTPILAGVTFVTPEHIGPIRDGVKNKNCFFVEPDSTLACAGCQSKNILRYNIDFRDCIYEDFLCLNHMTFEKFKFQIESNNLL